MSDIQVGDLVTLEQKMASKHDLGDIGCQLCDGGTFVVVHVNEQGGPRVYHIKSEDHNSPSHHARYVGDKQYHWVVYREDLTKVHKDESNCWAHLWKTSDNA